MILLPASGMLAGACARDGVGAPDVQAQAAGGARGSGGPLTPYTVVLHSLRGPVARVVTCVYDREMITGDDRMISRDCKVYNRAGQLTSETIDTEGYDCDTLMLDYAPDGRLVIEDTPEVVAVYDERGSLVRVENYDDPADGNARPAMVTFFSYDELGRLTSEAVATGDGISVGGEWLTVDEYEYGPNGLIRICRDEIDGNRSIMEMDDTGAPAREDLFDDDGNCLRHSDYIVRFRDRCGNWTDACVTTSHRDGASVTRLIHREIAYYGE